MPIAITELEEASQPLPDRIVVFLGKNRDKAYTDLEIFGGVEGYDQMSLQMATIFWTPEEKARALAPLRAALADLLRRGLIQRGKRRGEDYWAAAPKKSR